MDAEFAQVLKRHPNARTPERKEQFFEAYKRLGNANAAADEIGENRNTCQGWLRRWRKRKTNVATATEASDAA